MMTYTTLRQRGIQHLEKMTGQSWTDFNPHDPGITLLETLCYALTDLFYRIGFDVPDLLAEGRTDRDSPYASFHGAAELLTTRAVTVNDLRRVVIDVEGVKNAWIENVDEFLENQITPLLGLYRVVIETSSERGGIEVRREVGRRLHKHRGLCEEFTDIVILDPLPIRIDAKVEIGRVDDPAITYAQILDAMAEILSPTIPFVSLAERLQTGATMEEIFDGPLLEHGFITDEALEQAFRREAIHASDILRAVMAVPGVRAVTDVVISAGDVHETWSFDIPAGRVSQLDRFASRITLKSAGLPVVIGDPPRGLPSAPRIKLGPNAGITNPPSHHRNVADYQSVQHHLPDIYGIGEVGLPDSAPPARKARAKQLQAYLMLFDQLLANQFAQLAQVKDLFSIHPADNDSSKYTYFTQTVDEPTLRLSLVATATSASLASLGEQHAGYVSRKHRFLNHLLARFAENLNDRYAAATGAALDPIEDLIKHKQNFLMNYPRISGTRGTGFDFLGPWGTANPSGLEERINFKLGLLGEHGEDKEEIAVLEHIQTRPGQLHRFEWLLDKLPTNLRDPYSLKITFVLPADQGRYANVNGGVYPFRELVEQTLRAQTPAHIGTYVLWVNNEEWQVFHDAHVEWRRRRREHFAAKLGISLGLDPRLRVTLPGLPLVPGYLPLTGNEPFVVDYGSTIDVQIDGSQEGGAMHSLLRASDNAIISDPPVVGTGKSIVVESKPVLEDLVVRVQVERSFDDTILLDAVHTVKVRANPAVDVEVNGAFPDPALTSRITIHNSQASVQYSVYARPLEESDFFQPANMTTVSVIIPLNARFKLAQTTRLFVPPLSQSWNDPRFRLISNVIAGNGGDLQIPIGTITRDTIAIVRAHKEHGATPPDATDIQITEPVVLLPRPSSAPSLKLTRMGNNSITVTGGEPGVFYYLLDPSTNELLGKPAYFHRRDEVDSSLNRGIGQLRVGRDFVVARGPVPPAANRATTTPLDPVVIVPAIPTGNTVAVLATRARTRVAWGAARNVVITAP